VVLEPDSGLDLSFTSVDVFKMASSRSKIGGLGGFMKWLLILLAVGVGQAQAEPISCIIEGAVKCQCTHAMTVNCDNGSKGFIDNNEKIASVTVRVVDSAGVSRSVRLNNPPGGVMEYYTPAYSEWVKTELNKKRVIYKEIAGESFTVMTAPQLFVDSRGTRPVNGAGVVTPLNGLECAALSEPKLIRGVGPNCSGQKTCLMTVRCRMLRAGTLVGNLGDTDAVCKSVNGACPSATVCANDKDVTWDIAAWSAGAPTNKGVKQ
jgi:hypothetical protein